MRHLIVQTLKKSLAKRGFEVRRTAPLDLRDTVESIPELLVAKSRQLPHGVLVEVPLERCRNGIGTSFDHRNPFVIALKEGPPQRYEGSLLEKHYDSFRPISAADVLGLTDDEAPGFAELPPAAYVMPWLSVEPMTLLRKRETWMTGEARAYGCSLTLADGFNHFGPVAPAKGELELERYLNLWRSIQLNGFQCKDSPDGDVRGWLLCESTGRWCVQIASGLHRITVAAALDYQSIPIRIQRAPIMRENHDYWPQVGAGRITPSGALKVFDRVMLGAPPTPIQSN